jgi:cytochrome c-type protein NapC
LPHIPPGQTSDAAPAAGTPKEIAKAGPANAAR